MSRLHRGCILSGIGPRTVARRLGHYGARQHAYTQQLAAAGHDLTYVHNPDLTHGFIQFTRWPRASRLRAPPGPVSDALAGPK